MNYDQNCVNMGVEIKGISLTKMFRLISLDSDEQWKTKTIGILKQMHVLGM